jgi:copper homeostasis protein
VSPKILIEVCVDSVASAIAAERGGAQRLELCSSLLEGGITPSAGLIELVRCNTSIGLHVMIRPRGGDFCYMPEELETMRRDIAVAKNLGADGVVFGILDAGGTVDTERTRSLVDHARPLSVTFHRAIDLSADIFRALEDICLTGADRLLTSGGELSALQAVPRIARLVDGASGRIRIMACGGINASNAKEIIEQTGVREIHVGLRSPVASPMLYQNPNLSLGTVAGREYQRFQVLEEDVRSLSRALRSTSQPKA